MYTQQVFSPATTWVDIATSVQLDNLGTFDKRKAFAASSVTVNVLGFRRLKAPVAGYEFDEGLFPEFEGLLFCVVEGVFTPFEGLFDGLFEPVEGLDEGAEFEDGV